MGLDGYRLRAQLGAGPDGIAYRAETEDGQTLVMAYDLSSARRRPAAGYDFCLGCVWRLKLNHPAAIRDFELGTEQDPPYVILEWAGTGTLAAAVEAGLDSDETARTVACALTECLALHIGSASRMAGFARNGFYGEDGQPKLDFTGAQVGFPAEPAGASGLYDSTHAESEATAMASERAGDLFDLGALLSRCTQAEHAIRRPSQTASELEPIGGCLRGSLMKLRSPDPAERPTAAEVQTQLESLFEPLDATGNWCRTEAIGSATIVPRIDARGEVDLRYSVAALAAGANAPRLGRYQFLDKLGEGGQGVVYRRQSDPADGSIVALKVLRTDRGANSAMLQRFRKEARLMAQVNNPNVVNLLEFNAERRGAVSGPRIRGRHTRRPATRRAWPARWTDGARDHGGRGQRAGRRPRSAASSTATSSLPTSCCSARWRGSGRVAANQSLRLRSGTAGDRH